MSVVDWVCKKISLESASERLSAITISRQQVLPSKLDACANVTTCCFGGLPFERMWVTKASPGEDNGDYGSLIVGFSSTGFTAIIRRFYRSAGSSISRPRSVAAILAPPLCGSIAALSWHYLVSNPIKTRKLRCAACASIRGSLILVLNGCLLPSFLTALLYFKRNPSLQQPVAATFLDFCYNPYLGRSKPYVIGLGAFQAVLGYGLASWIYTEEFIKTRNNKKKL